MATCGFCGRKFQGKQAVKAHLKGCDAYKGGLPKAEVPQALPQAMATGLGSDRVTHFRQEVEAEQARLKLREVQAAHADLDEREAARTKRRQEEAERARQETHARELARRKAEQEAQERRLREITEQTRQWRRRQIIQRVKDEVIGRWWKLGYSIPLDVKAEALQEIEAQLSVLAVDELPRGELVEIAEGIRDKLYRPVIAAQDEARAREEERRRHEEAERRAVEETERQKRQEQWRQEQQARERAERKRSLVLHGLSFGREALDDHSDLDWDEREDIVLAVKRELERRLEGTETEAEVEEFVDDMLAEVFDDESDEEGEDED